MRIFVKAAIAAGAFLLLLAGLVTWQSRELPGVSEIRSRLRAGCPPGGHSTWVPLSAISPKLPAAVLVSEDAAFYYHRGFNFAELRKSFLENVRAGRYRRGGSTITQQLAKNFFLGPEKTLRRKFREAILTWRLERALSKNEILEAYLNIVEWGEGTAGAEAAAQLYFEKPAADLNWSEAALLAAILPNPRRLDPRKAPDDAMRHRQIVLLKLLANGDMSEEGFLLADAAPWRPQSSRATPTPVGRPAVLGRQ